MEGPLAHGGVGTRRPTITIRISAKRDTGTGEKRRRRTMFRGGEPLLHLKRDATFDAFALTVQINGIKRDILRLGHLQVYILDT